jgi:ParB family chromosome partitioning protein
VPEAFHFKDPHAGHALEMRIVPVGDLDVIPYQRKARPAHIDHVAISIERLGFLAPPIAVEQDGRLVVIDGQHRLLAARKLGLSELPVIVVPPELARRMMNLNVEKDLNIKERSAVALAIYRDIADSEPELAENDADVQQAVDQAHLVTLGLAYEKAAMLAGSSFEPILKRCDTFEDAKMADALETRRARAEQVLEAHKLVKSVTAKAKELGATSPYITQQIVAIANPQKGKRGPSGFDDTFDKLIANLRKLEENPERVARAAG